MVPMSGIKIYTDGAARGNPGASASGFSVFDGDKLLYKHSEYNGKTTNNYAEYRAVLLALIWCGFNLEDSHDRTISLYSDSELVIKQLKGEYRTKSESLMLIATEVRKLARKFKAVRFNNLRREDRNISAVDKGLNALLDKMEKQTE